MKRILSAAVIAASISLPAFAQEENIDTKPMWGLRAAFDVNLPGNYHGEGGDFKMYRHGYGFTLGTVCNIYLGKGFYLEPGASFFYDSYKCDFVVAVEPDGIAGSASDDPLLYKMGLRVPVMVGYEFNVAGTFPIDVYTGPELSYAFAGDTKLKGDYPGLDIETSPFSTQRRVDCAWKIGVGFPMGAWMVSIDGAIGITDLLKTGMSFRENRVSLGVTRYF